MSSDSEELEKLRKKIRQLEEELEKEREKRKSIEEDFEEHKKECAPYNKGTPAFVKEEVSHKVRRALGAPKDHKGYWRKIPERIDFIKPLHILACPCCGGELSDVQEVRRQS